MSEVYLATLNNEVVYVGKGTKNRSLHLNSGKSSCYEANALHFSGGKVEITIVCSGVSNQKALEEEKGYIANLKPLWNKQGGTTTYSDPKDITIAIDYWKKRVLGEEHHPETLKKFYSKKWLCEKHSITVASFNKALKFEGLFEEKPIVLTQDEVDKNKLCDEVLKHTGTRGQLDFLYMKTYDWVRLCEFIGVSYSYFDNWKKKHYRYIGGIKQGRMRNRIPKGYWKNAPDDLPFRTFPYNRYYPPA